jgi:hypothetical protein
MADGRRELREQSQMEVEELFACDWQAGWLPTQQQIIMDRWHCSRQLGFAIKQ